MVLFFLTEDARRPRPGFGPVPDTRRQAAFVTIDAAVDDVDATAETAA